MTSLLFFADGCANMSGSRSIYVKLKMAFCSSTQMCVNNALMHG